MYSGIVDRIGQLRQSVNGRILTATLTVAIFASLVRVVSISKEMVIARIFGAGDALDAFYLALLVPGFLAGIVSSFGSAFVPIYIQVGEEEGELSAKCLFSSILVCDLTILVGLCLLLAGSAKWILPVIGSGFGPAKLALTRRLFFVSLGLLLVSGVSALWRATLNARDCFAITAFAPIMSPAIILAALLLGSGPWRIYILALATVLGSIGELTIAGYALWSRGIPLLPRWYGLSGPVRRVLGQTAPVAAGALLMGSTTLVDQSMAAMLGPGSVAALNYANKVTVLLLSVGVSSLATAVLPNFSKLGANQEWLALRRAIGSCTKLIVIVTVPLTVTLIALSDRIIVAFFQGGAFTAQSAALVARVQSLLFLQLPFYAVGNLYVNAISSLQRNQILMWGTVLAISVNAALNVLFMKFFGLAGIALSTSCVYLINVLYLRTMLARVLGQAERDGAKSMSRVPSIVQVS
jgi:putative peptidoglycan lipid II flippase